MVLSVVSAAGGVCSAQQVVDWQAAIAGAWSDPTRWSGGVVPNNSGPNTFIARILIPGSYQVTADINATLSGFEFNATGASLVFSGVNRTFSTTGTNVLRGASITGSGGSSFIGGGNTVLGGGGAFTNVSSMQFGGQVDIVDADDFDLCDTCLDLRGTANWMGLGRFVLEGVSGSSEILIGSGATLSATGSGNRVVTSGDAANRVVNEGTIAVNLASATDELRVEGATFLNQLGGTVRVQRGKFRTNALGSLQGARLSGGRWIVEADGEVDLLGQQVEILDTTVSLRGAGAAFGGLDTLEMIGVDGWLAVRDGKVFETSAAQPVFGVEGGIDVGEGSSIRINSTLMNVQGSALRGGYFTVAGTLELDAGPIYTLGTDLVLSGAGEIRALGTTQNLLAGLSNIESGASLELANSAAFGTAGDLTLDGRATVRAGSSLTVNGDLSAFQAGTLVGGNLQVFGTVTANNARVERVAGTLMVGRTGELLAPDGAGTVDALSFLQRVETSGVFGLDGGRVLDLTATSNLVTVAGRLVLTGSGVEGPGNTGSRLLASGYIQESSGELAISMASLSDYGSVAVDILRFGSGAAGETAGTLRLTLDAGFMAAVGDEFLLIELNPMGTILGGGFAALVVEGSGFVFQQYLGADGLGVRVVSIPAPACGALLAMGVLASRRRRA